MLNYRDSGDKNVAFACLLEYFSYCPHFQGKKNMKTDIFHPLFSINSGFWSLPIIHLRLPHPASTSAVHTADSMKVCSQPRLFETYLLQ